MRILSAILAVTVLALGWALYASSAEIDRLNKVAGEAIRAVGEAERANEWTRAIEKMTEICSRADAVLVGALIKITDGLPKHAEIGCQPNPRGA